MAVTVEQVNVLVTAEVDKALKDLKKVQKAPDGVKSSFINMAKTIAGPAAAGLMIKAFIDFARLKPVFKSLNELLFIDKVRTC